MGTKRDPGKFDYYAQAEDDEPIFVLLGRDPASRAAIKEWCRTRARGPIQSSGDEEVLAAMGVVGSMEEFAAARAKRLGREALIKELTALVYDHFPEWSTRQADVAALGEYLTKCLDEVKERGLIQCLARLELKVSRSEWVPLRTMEVGDHVVLEESTNGDVSLILREGYLVVLSPVDGPDDLVGVFGTKCQGPTTLKGSRLVKKIGVGVPTVGESLLRLHDLSIGELFKFHERAGVTAEHRGLVGQVIGKEGDILVAIGGDHTYFAGALYVVRCPPQTEGADNAS